MNVKVDNIERAPNQHSTQTLDWKKNTKTSTDRGRGDAYCSRKSRLHDDDEDELAMMILRVKICFHQNIGGLD